MSWDLLRNKRRDVGGMVLNIPVNNQENLEFLCNKKRGVIPGFRSELLENDLMSYLKFHTD